MKDERVSYVSMIFLSNVVSESFMSIRLLEQYIETCHRLMENISNDYLSAMIEKDKQNYISVIRTVNIESGPHCASAYYLRMFRYRLHEVS